MTDALFDMPAEAAPPEFDLSGCSTNVDVYPLVPTRAMDIAWTYALPDELRGTVEVGSIVEMPLIGPTRVGVVARVDTPTPAGVALKPITRVVDTPTIPPALVDLAPWIAEQFGCAVALALSLVVNPRFAAQARAAAQQNRTRQQAARRVVDNLDGLDLTKRQRELATQIPMAWATVAELSERLSTTRTTLGKLAEAGVLQLEDRYLDEIDGEAGVGSEGESASDGFVLEPSELTPAPDFVPMTLTPVQLAAVDACAGTIDDGLGPATLLMGITGSGKTEVYLEVIARSLADGRDAIVLVPEIALTPQTARRFLERFPGTVEVLHSGMTKAERATAHDRIARGEARVVVGPRSAVFAPVRNLGVLVIDEEHDGSYKQDSEPRYDARRVAFRRVMREGARLILGSATPRPESWHGVRRRVPMFERPAGGKLAPLDFVDLREHEDDYPLTTPVQDAIEATLRRGRKVIVLHNRRGFATALHCRGCGHTFRCPRCDVSLVIHGRIARRQRLTCHHCGHGEQTPEQCPECSSTDIARMGAGTERIETLLAERFANCEVFRLDADAVKTRGAVSQILAEFRATDGPAILVGTQMVAKGHDFPDVELAVVIDADAALSIPDFRAEERAFSLVAQLAGRAGRSASTAEHAKVLVQTWNPNHPFLRFARSHDVAGFLDRELSERKPHGWPPYQRIVRVLVSARNEGQRDQWALAVADGMRRLGAGSVLGPAPLLRLNDRERSQVLVATSRATDVAAAVRRFLGRTESDRRKVDVRVILDVDPQSLM